jgi:hypothetical protein
MASHLSLIKSDIESLEKRVFPRFPFCYMNFKDAKHEQVFEISDISHTGMQINLKNGENTYTKEDKISGDIRWQGKQLSVLGAIRWKKGTRIGVEFANKASLRESLNDFLSISHFAQNLKPVHQVVNVGVEWPPRLKFWFRADGPVEIFIWQHGDGEWSRFQLIYMEHFVEWEDGKGLKSARVISKRDIETPLLSEDEFVFQIDENLSLDRLKIAKELVSNAHQSNVLSQDIAKFLMLKLG